MSEDELRTVPEVAKRLRLSEYTVREYLRTGKLRGYRPGGTRAGWRVRDEDVDQFIAATVNVPARDGEAD